MLRYFSRGLFLLAFGLLVLGYFGGLHPALDSLAIGRIGLVVAAAVLAPLAFGTKGWVAAVLLLGSALPLLPLDRGEAGPLTIYSKNIYFRNADPMPIIADIRAVSPDVIVLQEVGTRQAAVMAAFAESHPHQALCRWAGWNGIAVLSRYEMVPGTAACSPQRAFNRVRVAGPEGAFWVVGVHLEWPWPKEQAAMVEASLPVITGLAGDVIVAGDFNQVPWSQVAQRIGQATGTKALTPRQTTFWLGWVPLPIDQVWSTCGGHVTRRPQLTSDHHGLVARVFAGDC